MGSAASLRREDSLQKSFLSLLILFFCASWSWQIVWREKTPDTKHHETQPGSERVQVRNRSLRKRASERQDLNTFGMSLRFRGVAVLVG